MTRIAVLEKDKCHPLECGGHLCTRLCPVNRTDKECIVKSDDGKVYINEELCIGCGICVKRCPAGAINIINLPEELKSEPIHRYGGNGFALYNLPIPIIGKVVGIIGKNGIGKSSAIKILAGIEKPNLGIFDREIRHEEIIEYFKGTEAHSYFEKLKNNEMKISYKPQQVELIPRQYDGTVKELLEKVDEKGELKKVCEELELTQVLDHDIKKISGGELQRVAIAACVLKKANIYFFDEPTSYLDVKQRLKISTFIRELANNETGVMVIEHDMIILDYMADLVHLMYGKPSVYGVASQPKSAKAGINIYLSGYLKEENIRFRDKPIIFDSHAPIDMKRDNLMTQWDKFSLKLGSFELKAKQGDIYYQDMIGILGENGIGKTSFVKALAGKIGEHKIKELEIAYKPQYIEPTEELVMTFLEEAINNYKTQLITPLEIEGIMMRKLTELSGGELQRVYIAKVLSEKADLILMDEPSAYLDIEQRLKLGKIIRNVLEIKGKSAMIVDHDLLFMDTISDRLIVFEGVPAIKGDVQGPFYMQEGMNKFLKNLRLTFRRDEETLRPRINKPGSQKDEEQKKSGKLYYG